MLLSDWIEKNCRHPDADAAFAGKEVRLMDWQKDFCDKLYPKPGGRSAKHGLCLTSVKTGKSSMAAWISLAMLSGDYEGEFVNLGVIAPTLRQAAIIKNYIQSAAYNSGMECRAKEDCLKFSRRKKVEILSGRPQSKQGMIFSPGVLIDEAAEMTPEGANFYFNMTDFTEKGLCLMLSNPPSRRDNPIQAFIKKKPSRSFVKYMVKTDLRANWRDPAVWKKANPALKIRPKLLKVYRDKVKRLSFAPAEVPLFERLWLSKFNYSSGHSWFKPELIQPCPKKLMRRAEKEATWFAGIDFSSAVDLTAVTLAAEIEDKTILKCYGFLPRAAAEKKIDRQAKRAAFLFHNKQREIFLTQAECVNPAEILRFLEKKQDQSLTIFPKIGIDRARCFSFEKEAGGFEICAVNKGNAAITNPTIEFERRAINKKIFCNSELLRFCLGNARMSPPENAEIRAVYKSKSQDSVDAAISSILSLYMLQKYKADAEWTPRVYSF